MEKRLEMEQKLVAVIEKHLDSKYGDFEEIFTCQYPAFDEALKHFCEEYGLDIKVINPVYDIDGDKVIIDGDGYPEIHGEIHLTETNVTLSVRATHYSKWNIYISECI